jgi:hypothetical protein
VALHIFPYFIFIVFKFFKKQWMQYVYIAGHKNKMSWSCPVATQVPFCMCPEQIVVPSVNNKILEFSLAVTVNL